MGNSCFGVVYLVKNRFFKADIQFLSVYYAGHTLVAKKPVTSRLSPQGFNKVPFSIIKANGLKRIKPCIWACIDQDEKGVFLAGFDVVNIKKE